MQFHEDDIELCFTYCRFEHLLILIKFLIKLLAKMKRGLRGFVLPKRTVSNVGKTFFRSRQYTQAKQNLGNRYSQKCKMKEVSVVLVRRVFALF